MNQLQRAFICLLLAIAALWFLAGFLAARAWAHDHYTHWKQANGASCCNERVEHADGTVTGDCRRVKARPIGNGAWVVSVDGQEIVVPPEKVLNIPSPDMSAHWCGMYGVTFCFVPAPEGL